MHGSSQIISLGSWATDREHDLFAFRRGDEAADEAPGSCADAKRPRREETLRGRGGGGQ
jgi:hypothetical protein